LQDPLPDRNARQSHLMADKQFNLFLHQLQKKLDINNNNNDGGNNQKLKLFKRGKAISGAPIKMGTNQLPKPPIITGMTIKKIMTMACAVTTTLYNWWFPKKNWLPGYASSIRINNDNIVPRTPAKVPKIKYNVPISYDSLKKINDLKIVAFRLAYWLMKKLFGYLLGLVYARISPATLFSFFFLVKRRI